MHVTFDKTLFPSKTVDQLRLVNWVYNNQAITHIRDIFVHMHLGSLSKILLSKMF